MSQHPVSHYVVAYGIKHTVLNNAIRDFIKGESWGLKAQKVPMTTMYIVEQCDFDAWYTRYQQNRQKRKVKKMQKFKQALESFFKSSDFSEGVIKSTKAGWGGSGYSVELFEDGTWRVLWDNEIGNLYESPGLILSLPQLSCEDLNEFLDNGGSESDFFYLGFENDRDEIEKDLRDRISDRESMYA